MQGCLSGLDELLDTNAGLTKDARQCSHFELTMKWNDTPTPILVPKNNMTPSLPDLTES